MVILAAVAFVYCWEVIPMSGNDKRGSFFYTLLGYLLILVFLLAIALLIGAILYRFVIVPKRLPSDDSLGKWIGFTLYTPLTFWFVIKFSRQRWHNKVFWLTMTSLLFVHIAGYLVIFRYVEHWRLLYSVAICMVEGPSIGFVVGWIFERFGKRHHSKDVAAHL